MEDLDRRIVGLLSQDGRMSFTDLGKVTGCRRPLPTSGCAGSRSAG
jgi:DNA-binding Lrp family transcriptional regulator